MKFLLQTRRDEVGRVGCQLKGTQNGNNSCGTKISKETEKEEEVTESIEKKRSSVSSGQCSSNHSESGLDSATPIKKRGNMRYSTRGNSRTVRESKSEQSDSGEENDKNKREARTKREATNNKEKAGRGNLKESEKSKRRLKDDESQESSDESASEDSEESNDEYVVEKILDKRYNKKKKTVEYLIKWEGYDAESDNTWEPEENCVSLVDTAYRNSVFVFSRIFLKNFCTEDDNQYFEIFFVKHLLSSSQNFQSSFQLSAAEAIEKFESDLKKKMQASVKAKQKEGGNNVRFLACYIKTEEINERENSTNHFRYAA